jgi:hypothetical protein
MRQGVSFQKLNTAPAGILFSEMCKALNAPTLIYAKEKFPLNNGASQKHKEISVSGANNTFNLKIV